MVTVELSVTDYDCGPGMTSPRSGRSCVRELAPYVLLCLAVCQGRLTRISSCRLCQTPCRNDGLVEAWSVLSLRLGLTSDQRPRP
jgi:hypothetical protein